MTAASFVLALTLSLADATDDSLPPASDLKRFPPACVADACRRTAEQAVACIEWQMRHYPHLADRLYWVWQAARDAADVWQALDRCHGWGNDRATSEHLSHLRWALGDEAYGLGWMPPATVPLLPKVKRAAR